MKTNLFLLSAAMAIFASSQTRLVAQSGPPASGGGIRPPISLPSGGTVVSLPGSEPSGDTVSFPTAPSPGGTVTLPDSGTPGLVVTFPGSSPTIGTVSIPAPRPSGGTVSLPGSQRPTLPKSSAAFTDRSRKLPGIKNQATMDPLPATPATKYIGETEKSLAKQNVKSRR